ncbi:MAG: ABC transporter permease [Chloroflexi bacterium]|nr:ABC transporter permease [Chloroflexota bacterium]MDL1943519.1 ABC transporter permease [Chloroflexi bacterium CFX2]
MKPSNAKFISRESEINLAVQKKYSRKDTGWRLFLKTIIARAYPRIVGQQREISWMVFDVIMPMLMVISYVLVYRALNAPEEYIGFVVMGGAMTAFWMNILWSMSSQLYWEKEQGNLALYIMAPNSMMAILLGMALGGMLATAMRALAVTLLGIFLFGVTYTVSSYLQLFLVFLLAMAALYGMGMMMASAFLLFGREAWHMANLAQEPIFLASGFYFPIKSLPFWVAAGASVIPLTLGMDAMWQLVFPTGFQFGFLSVQLEILILAILSVVFIVTAKILLAHIEKLAVREGRITESRR